MRGYFAKLIVSAVTFGGFVGVVQLLLIRAPNLNWAARLTIAILDKNEVRPWMRAVIFDAAGDLVGTDGRMVFVGKHGGVEKDVLVEFPHRPPAKFDTCTIDTDKLLARYVENRTGQSTQLSITIPVVGLFGLAL